MDLKILDRCSLEAEAVPWMVTLSWSQKGLGSSCACAHAASVLATVPWWLEWNGDWVACASIGLHIACVRWLLAGGC
jgi:hypothetical protein